MENAELVKNIHKPKRWLIITLLILDLMATGCLVLAYGPIDTFRNWLVTTALTTGSHQYLASIIYDDATIKKTLANNYVQESGENTNTDAIIFDSNSQIYSSKYDEEILTHDADALYKIIKINGTGYVGYLVAIYDASRVSLALATRFGYAGEYCSTIAKNNDAIIAMNASGFEDPGLYGKCGQATGIVFSDGNFVYEGPGTGFGGGLIGFNQDNVLVLSHDMTAAEATAAGIRDAVSFGPFLIVNGEAAFIKGNGGWGTAPRSAIAQRKDGIVLFLVVDGRQAGYSLGIDMVEMTKILQNYGAYNASNLDGGGSSVLVVEGSVYNEPCAATRTGERAIPDAWIVK